MPEKAIRTVKDIMRLGLENIYITDDLGLTLPPKNMLENPYFTEFDDEGPVGWSFSGLPPATVAHDFNVSYPGEPRRSTLLKQNSAPIPTGDGGYTQETPIVGGMKVVPTSEYVPPAPELVAATESSRGFKGPANHGWAWCEGEVRMGKVRITAPTNTCYFKTRVEDNNCTFLVPVPDSFQRNTNVWVICLVRPETQTLFVQEIVPINELRDTYEVKGPFRGSRKPPKKNQTGRGRAPRLKKNRDYRIRGGKFGCKEGRYYPAMQYIANRGRALVGPFGDVLVIRGDREWRQTGTETIERPVNVVADALVAGRDVDGVEVLSGSYTRATPPDGISDRLVRQHLGEPLYEAMVAQADGLKPEESVSSTDAMFAEARGEPLVGERGGEEPPAGHADAEANGPSEFHQAEGKRENSPYVRAGGSYAGEEIDFVEDQLKTLLNERRSEARLSKLILNRDLTRVAYREVGGPRDTEDPAYPGGYETFVVYTERNDATDAASLISEYFDPSGRFAAVGVAREINEDSEDWRYKWCVAFGNTVVGNPVSDRYADVVCELVHEGHTHRFGAPGSGREGEYLYSLSPDMTRYEDVEYAEGLAVNTSQGWSCVGGTSQNPTLGWRYSGSYRASLENAMQNLTGKCKVRVFQGGDDLSISDGSLEGNVYGRTYSDGRMVGDQYLLSVKSGSTNEAMWGHEGLHAMGQPHQSSQNSLMYPSISDGKSPVPSSGDYTRLRDTWGSATTDPGGGTGGGTGGGNEPETETIERPVYELVNTGIKKNCSIWFRIPKYVKQNHTLRFCPWLMWEPLDGSGSGDDSGTTTGGRTTYRVYPARRGTSQYFNDVKPFDKGIFVHAYTPESEPPGLLVSLVQEELPTEDETRIEDPDPNGAPDVPLLGGKPNPPAGRYIATVNARLSDGTVSKPSPLGQSIEGTGQDARVRQFIDITDSQVIRINPALTVNRLRNAEFSETNARGEPENWTPQNMGVLTNNYSVDEGVLTLVASSPTTDAPRMTNDLVAVAADSVVLATGSIGADSLASGSARVSVRQYDESRTLLSGKDIMAAEIPQGQVGDIEYARLITPEQRDPDCAFVAKSDVFVGASVQGRARFYNHKLFTFDENVRKYEENEEFGPDNLNVSAATPVSGSPFVMYGAPLTPAGLEQEVPEPPVELVNFTSGAWPSGWTEITGTYAASDSIASGSKIGQGLAWNVFDTTSGVRTKARRKTYTQLSGKAIALRFLMEGRQIPTWGYVTIGRVMNSIATITMAALRLYADGTVKLVRYMPTSKTYTEYAQPVYTGLRDNQVLDCEIIVKGGMSKKGAITVGIGQGSRQIAVELTDIDYTNHAFRTVEVGPQNVSDGRAKFNFFYDQIVVTERGDIPQRERPAVPANYTPPDEDRPKKSVSGVVGPRKFFSDPLDLDEDGNPTVKEIIQPYMLIPEGFGRCEIKFLRQPKFVVPGETYTFCTFFRYSIFGSDEIPGMRIKLTGEGMEPRYLKGNALTGQGLTNLMAKKPWHASGRATAREDDWISFTVPAPKLDSRGLFERGYTYAELEFVCDPGAYVFQEPGWGKGVLDTFAKREAIRTFERATSGRVTAVMDTAPEAFEAGFPALGFRYADFGIKDEEVQDMPPGVEIKTLFSTSSDLESYTVPSSDPEDIASYDPSGVLVSRTPFRHLKMDHNLIGNTYESPLIPAGGQYVRTWIPFGTLLREDSTSFPGCAFVGNVLIESNYPEMEFDRVSGHVIRIRQGEDIGWVGPIYVTVSTEEAFQEISLLSRTDDLQVEAVLAGGRVAGRAWRIRCADAISWEQSKIPSTVLRDIFDTGRRRGHTKIHAVGTIELAEILEAADLPAPRSPSVPLPELISR